MKNHCQICSRDIKANTGLIAHHGYQRPGGGWQTASCMGAKYLPYEVSRDRIPTVIESYKDIRQNNIDREKELLANPPATVTRFARYGFQKNEVYTLPENFDPAVALESGSYSQTNDDRYASEYKGMVKECRSNVAGLTYEIKRLQKRYDDWEAK